MTILGAPLVAWGDLGNVVLVGFAGGVGLVLERARHVAAVQASNIAGYRTLERLAAAAGDPDTEALAARLGEQEQQTFDRILGKLQTLADTLD